MINGIKMPKNLSNNVTGFVLQLMGSLVFLAVASALWGVAAAPTNWVSGLAGGAFWATLFYAVAVLTSVSLLFLSFAQLGNFGEMTAWRTMKLTTMAGFSLAVLSASSFTLLIGTIIGFLVASIGNASVMMKMGWKEHRR